MDHEERSTHSTDNGLLDEIFPVGARKEFVIEAPPKGRKNQRRKRIVGRFPLGLPTLGGESIDWNLKRYPVDPESGEPGGWHLGNHKNEWTHKGTPLPTEVVKTWVALKLTSSGTMEVYPIDEAYTFRPVVRHPGYSLEEAESLMAAKKKNKLTPAIKKQILASDNQTSKPGGSPTVSATSHGEKAETDSDNEVGSSSISKGNSKRKKRTGEEYKVRAARSLQKVVATDTLIEQIKPGDVEDWEYTEKADDDDVSMGGDVEDQEQEQMEVDYKQYADTDSADEYSEGGSKIQNQEFSDLKVLLKNGANKFVPPPTGAATAAAATTEDKKKTNHEPLHATTRAAANEDGSQNVCVPTELSEAELARFLLKTGPISLKTLVNAFNEFLRPNTEQHRMLEQRFIGIVKTIAFCKTDTATGKKTVELKHDYQKHLRSAAQE